MEAWWVESSRVEYPAKKSNRRASISKDQKMKSSMWNVKCGVVVRVWVLREARLDDARAANAAYLVVAKRWQAAPTDPFDRLGEGCSVRRRL